MKKQLILIIFFLASFQKTECNPKLLTAAVGIPVATIGYNFWQDKKLVEENKDNEFYSSHRGVGSSIGSFAGFIPPVNVLCVAGWGICKLDEIVNNTENKNKGEIAMYQGFVAGMTSLAIVLARLRR